MATRTIGKLKFNISKRGIAYKWGDGEIHCHRFGSGESEEEREEQTARRDYDGEDYYEEYANPDEDYNGEEYEEEEQPSGVMSYMLTHDWVMWLSLLLLAPLGIYILWKRKQFDIPVRTGISIASLVLFIMIIILLFGGRGGSDRINNTTKIVPVATATMAAPTYAPVVTTAPTLAPTPTPVPEITPRPDDGFGTETGSDTEGTGDGTEGDDVTVYFTPNGKYYHTSSTCGSMTNATASTLSYARTLGKTACPDCYGADGEGVAAIQGTVYYATDKGTYFHLKSGCSGMKNASEISQADAEAKGKIPCPTCVGYYATTGGKYYHTKKDCSGMKNAGLYTLASCTKRNQTACPVCMGNTSDTNVYYHTSTGKYYHTDAKCSGMKNATKVSLAVALASNQTACPKCVGSDSASAYYATDKGKYYHSNKTCSGMKNAKQVTKSAAEANGKTACPTCIGTIANSATKVYYTAKGTYYHVKSNCSGMKGAQASTIEAAKTAGKTACPTCIQSSGTYVYCTSGGKYYHTEDNCSGMKNATFVSIETAKKNGKTACPTCIGIDSKNKTTSSSSATVYCTDKGTYYHLKSNCSGMKNAKSTTVNAAIASGKKACPTCIGKTDDTKVYATNAGVYYHSKSNCSGMSGAKATTVTAAKTSGKFACPVCVGNTDTKVYLTKNGTYYHSKSTCSGMSGASFVALDLAKSLGKTACPSCLGSKTALTTVSSKTDSTAKSGTNNSSNLSFTVYCTSGGTYYHTDKTCRGMSGAKATTLSAAVSGGKYPCPDCVNAEDENMVYANPDGRYYHTNKTCSGMSNASAITINVAKANGKTACPTCAGGKVTGGTKTGNKTTASSSSSSSSKTDKVYITTSNKYYHTNRTCSGITNANATTKERAVYTYSKTACPVCCGTSSSSKTSTGTSVAKAAGSDTDTYATLTKVYCTKNGKYYHYKSTCSGMKGATATTAKAASESGKSPCPVCINTTSSTKVYTSVNNPYYHKKSVCGGVTLDIATNYTNAVAAGKTGCPSCTGKTTTTESKVYATLTSEYYHTKSTCTIEDLAGASYISLTKAKNYNKTPCPACASN